MEIRHISARVNPLLLKAIASQDEVRLFCYFLKFKYLFLDSCLHDRNITKLSRLTDLNVKNVREKLRRMERLGWVGWVPVETIRAEGALAKCPWRGHMVFYSLEMIWKNYKVARKLKKPDRISSSTINFKTDSSISAIRDEVVYLLLKRSVKSQLHVIRLKNDVRANIVKLGTKERGRRPCRATVQNQQGDLRFTLTKLRRCRVEGSFGVFVPEKRLLHFCKKYYSLHNIYGHDVPNAIDRSAVPSISCKTIASYLGDRSKSTGSRIKKRLEGQKKIRCKKRFQSFFDGTCFSYGEFLSMKDSLPVGCFLHSDGRIMRRKSDTVTILPQRLPLTKKVSYVKLNIP